MRGPDGEARMPATSRPIENRIATEALVMKKALGVGKSFGLFLQIYTVDRVDQAAQRGTRSSARTVIATCVGGASLEHLLLPFLVSPGCRSSHSSLRLWLWQYGRSSSVASWRQA